MIGRLAHATDLDGFRSEARKMLAAGVPPDEVQWVTAGEADLFSAGDGHAELYPQFLTPSPNAAATPSVQVPAAFLRLCAEVILHSDPARFGLLYRILWRLAHEPGLRHDPLDADMMRAQQMAHAVRRDMHKMKAFVRFRTVPDEAEPENPLHVAWFEPDHHIVEAVAPWFARRFTQMRWAILTPERCVAWDGKVLSFQPGASKSDAPPADAGEGLWLTYYQHIFNPARLKLKMMQKEMPRKYWHNLPEARFISELASQAHEKSGGMVDKAAPAPNRRIPVLPLGPAQDTGRRAMLSADGIHSLSDLKEARCAAANAPSASTPPSPSPALAR